jgi:hypothetical protein
MNAKEESRNLLIFSIGAVFGGITVAVITKAVPRIMAEMMRGMMQNMIAGMPTEGCSPNEI